MSQCQPLQQLARGFVRRLAVKRHHCRRHPRSAAQLRTPPVPNRRRLYLVRATADNFFEMMNGHG